MSRGNQTVIDFILKVKTIGDEFEELYDKLIDHKTYLRDLDSISIHSTTEINAIIARPFSNNRAPSNYRLPLSNQRNSCSHQPLSRHVCCPIQMLLPLLFVLNPCDANIVPEEATRLKNAVIFSCILSCIVVQLILHMLHLVSLIGL
ncbi:Uncharacterized protein Adt_45432 [Abeliophyllum distichum]|uniref:Uncharacterized protein n=1 Tax=Abeliophyllum distichum TaxID=126358 RepID=A0ABD1PDT7_9LAMI